MTTGRIIVAGAVGAGALVAASVPETLAPRAAREQLLASGISGLAGLAVGATVGVAATRLPTRVGSVAGASLALAGAGAWLALGGAPGEARAPAAASVGFLAAVGGTAMLAQHALGSRFGRPVGALLGAAAGAATIGTLVAAGRVAHRTQPHPQAPPPDDRPPWSLGGAGRSAIAGLVGAGIVGGALALAGGSRLVAAAPLGVRIGVGAAATLAVTAGAVKLSSAVAGAMGRHGSTRMSESVEIPDGSSGGARSRYAPNQLPANVERYLRQGVTSTRAATYRPDLPATELRDAIRAYVPLDVSLDATTRATAAIDELERLGAFERSVLHVVLPTGGGGINEGLTGIVESYVGGDSASIGLQYADRPSVLALSEAPEGAKLLDAFLIQLERRLQSLPGDARPRVVISGYSLGAEALRHALADAGTRARIDRIVDGVLLVGPRNLGEGPGRAGLDGAVVAESALDLPDAIPGDGSRARVVVLQHATDPTGNAVLGLGLRDARSSDLADRSSFVPFATLAGTAADMTLVGYRDVPLDAVWRGHGYSADLPDAVRVAFGLDDVPDSVRDLVVRRTHERLEGITLGDTKVGAEG
jgi:hypothetical protein